MGLFNGLTTHKRTDTRRNRRSSRELPTLSCKNSSALQAVVQAVLRVIFLVQGERKDQCVEEIDQNYCHSHTFLRFLCSCWTKIIGRSTHIPYIIKFMSNFFNAKEPNESINPVTGKVLATARIGNTVTYSACPFYFFASALIKLLHFLILILLYVLILFASVPHHRVEPKQWEIPRTKRTRPHPQSIAKLMTSARILEQRRGRSR